jgi:PAS domain S-box-containing protein
LTHPLSQDSDLQFRWLLEKLPAGAYTCDAHGLITYFNEAAVRLWGRAPKLHDPVDRFCGSFKLYLADGTPIDHDQCWMARALREERDFNGQEIIIERPDGSRLTGLAHASPIFDTEGRLLGAVNILVDISDRKRAEEAQAFLAAIVASSDDAIVGKNLQGTVQSWNAGAERLFGYSPQEMIGESILRIIPPDRRDEETEILSRICRGERVEHFETVRVAKDGRRLDVSLTVSPVCDSAGRIIGASKVGRDITERKRAEKAMRELKDELAARLADLEQLHGQLREADRRKDEFLATLAHELRNPLAPLSNALHILRLSDELSPAVEHVRDIMERQVNHMIRLVDDLIEVSRITRGKIELRKEQVDLLAVLGNAVETSRPLIEAAGHRLAITVPPEPMPLAADPVRLAQVVTNLLNNAAKYSDERGQIWLTARREGSDAVVSVKDAGLGIAPEMLPRIFEMFAQVEGARNRSQGGLGIGLTLAKRLVELHGGRMEAHSEGLGKGSEFVVRLPLSFDAQRLSAPPPDSPPPQASLPVRRVLIVDDTRAAAYILGKLLEILGQEVRSAHDAASALEMVRAEHFDVVISDIGMPDMNGYELAARLRDEPAWRGMAVVALTGYGHERDKQLAKEAGFNHYLVKPVSVDALRRLLSSLPDLETVGPG